MSHPQRQRFANPVPMPRGSRILQILRWRLANRPLPWRLPPPDPGFPPAPAPAPGQIIVTFIGHASFLLQLPGLTILTDPIFSARCSPVPFAGPKRVRPPGLRLVDLPKIDLILLSHNHYDHADMPSLRALAARHDCACVTLTGVDKLLTRAGFSAPRALGWWEHTQIGATEITATPAVHFSRRGLFDLNATLWGGFMLRHAGASVFFAGDSGQGPHWAEINTRLGAPDLALLPIGAYDPPFIMAPIHMNPEEALEAHLALGARASLGMHFGTFQLTAEPIDEPVSRLRAACAARGVGNFGVLGFGESGVFPAGLGH